MGFVLGISCFYHDSAVALIKDGEIMSAVQEERFTRKKHDSSFPLKSLSFVMGDRGLDLSDLDAIVFYDKPFLKFERILETHIDYAPFSFGAFQSAMPVWIKEKLFMRDLIHKHLRSFGVSFPRERIFFSEHHLSHAASAFYPSPFANAIILTVDGVGEWATTSVAIGEGSRITKSREIHFPDSLGLLYSAFTQYLGFKVNSGEYKVMGLAPFGTPRYTQKILDHIIDLKTDGSFRINQKYFNYAGGLSMINRSFEELFGLPCRKDESEALTEEHMDLAASIQDVTERAMLAITRWMAVTYKEKNLCLAGGVALNCVVNRKLREDGGFQNIWIQPASGDAGGALGAALYYWHYKQRNKRNSVSKDRMKGSFLGPNFEKEAIKDALEAEGAVFQEFDRELLNDFVAKKLSDGKVVGWFQGRMEFGPRALGSRSILADPRQQDMQAILNQKIKFRESFRPFAPAILEEEVSDWFETEGDNSYMLFTARLKEEHRIIQPSSNIKKPRLESIGEKRSIVPAITHLDMSARIQTVSSESNPDFHKLLTAFFKLTQVPMLVNTSFNVRGEPIVCSPADAFRCFMSTDIDLLVAENLVLDKTLQNPISNKSAEFPLD